MNENFNIKKNDTIVIIGGGFAGLQLARAFKNKDIKVIIIDKQNHHQFQPLFYQVASSRLEPASISFPFRKIFQGAKNLEFRMTTVLNILPETNTLITRVGEIEYDHLVIATGCKTNYFGNEVLSKFAMPMKTTQDAIRIRNKILMNFEEEVFANEKDRVALYNIVIAGAGATGVELSGAFAELRNTVLPKDYPTLDFTHLNIILVEGSDHTLNNMSEESKIASRNYLEKMGVWVRTGILIQSYDGKSVTLSTGEKIPTKILIWAAGVKGNIIDGLQPSEIIKNRYVVNRYNQLLHRNNIFAVGDIAYMETKLFPHGHPQVASVAINQAKLLAENIRRSLEGKKLKEYEYNDMGMLATIGKHKAVVDLPFIKFHGALAWYFWMFLHLMLILSVRNKIIIFINWAWSYFTKDTSLRLILNPEPDKEIIR